MEENVELFKMLSDETRLKILMKLYVRSYCVCELQDLVNESQPKISKHLQKLRNASLVVTTKKGQFIHYELAEHALLKLILSAILEQRELVSKGENEIECI